MDPIFEKEYDWTTARHGFLQLNTLLGMAKEVLHNRTIESSDDFFSMFDNLVRTIKDFSFKKTEEIQVTKILDTAFLVLKDGMTLTERLLTHHSDEILLYVRYPYL